MTIEPKFLNDVQRAGWNLVAVDEERAVAGCPRSDCNLTVNLKPGATIPEVCRPKPPLAEHAIASFDAARVALRGRREELGFTIRDVENIGGIADDYLAKFEKDDPAKIPNAQTFIEWAQALGYDVVFRPTMLTAMALRTIADTRRMLEARRKHFEFRARSR
jgi:hypothetical protein